MNLANSFLGPTGARQCLKFDINHFMVNEAAGDVDRVVVKQTCSGVGAQSGQDIQNQRGNQQRTIKDCTRWESEVKPQG